MLIFLCTGFFTTLFLIFIVCYLEYFYKPVKQAENPPLNRFQILRNRSQFLYDLKDSYYLPLKFIEIFESIEHSIMLDIDNNNSYYYSEDHTKYINQADYINSLIDLYNNNILLSINAIYILDKKVIDILYFQSTEKLFDYILDDCYNLYSKSLSDLLKLYPNNNRLNEFISIDYINFKCITSINSKYKKLCSYF